MTRLLPVVLLIVASAGCPVAVVNSCEDGILDGTESDIDCGGSCSQCGLNRNCNRAADCLSGVCTGGVCVAASATPTCTDGILNGTETDVDCGGASCGACFDGRGCSVAADCISQNCNGGRCDSAATSQLPDTSSAPLYSIDAGAGIVVAVGTQSGYGITANVGASYRVVWTGDGAATGMYHEFWGSMWTAGTFSNFVPGCAQNFCALESGDSVSQPYQVVGGSRIDFDTFASDGLDGFDVVASVEPVYFDLYIDGQHYPNLVFFTSGGAQGSPTALPFGLQVQ